MAKEGKYYPVALVGDNSDDVLRRRTREPDFKQDLYVDVIWETQFGEEAYEDLHAYKQFAIYVNWHCEDQKIKDWYNAKKRVVMAEQIASNRADAIEFELQKLKVLDQYVVCEQLVAANKAKNLKYNFRARKSSNSTAASSREESEGEEPIAGPSNYKKQKK